jgi:hypothetical protein
VNDLGTWAAKMAASTRTSEGYRAAVQEVAIGEALFASTLATVMLTNQVATGRMSHDEVSALLDGATLVLEHHRGDLPENAGAIDYARSRLTALMNLLEQMRQSRPMPNKPR